jgi:hypothetical protein
MGTLWLLLLLPMPMPTPLVVVVVMASCCFDVFPTCSSLAHSPCTAVRMCAMERKRDTRRTTTTTTMQRWIGGVLVSVWEGAEGEGSD